jgi:hypothetical protein
MSALSDNKTSTEANSLRGIALDHLGVIIARIRLDLDAAEKDQLKSLHEVGPKRLALTDTQTDLELIVPLNVTDRFPR